MCSPSLHIYILQDGVENLDNDNWESRTLSLVEKMGGFVSDLWFVTINQVGFSAIIKCRDYNHRFFFSFSFCNTRGFLFNCLVISPSAYLHSYKLDATYLICYLFVCLSCVACFNEGEAYKAAQKETPDWFFIL